MAKRLFEVWEGNNVLEVSLLETLYHTLLQLSADISQHQGQVGSISLEKQRLTDICEISDMLFEELDGQFGQFMPYRCLLSPTITRKSSLCEKNDLLSDTQPSTKYLVILLRCCVIVLHPLELKDPISTADRCRILIKLIKEFCCLDHTTQLPHQCTCEESSSCACFFKKCDPLISLRCSLLEAFVDELLIHQHIKKLFMATDNFFGINQKLFVPHSRFIGIAAILELISAHFILSVNDDGFSKFLLSIFCFHGMDHGIPQLSLTAIMPLLKTTVICSVPRMLQVHLILLASRTVGIYVSLTSGVSNIMLLHNYIAAFDQSVDLYRCLVVSLPLVVNLTQTNNQSEFWFKNSCRSDCFLHLSTNSYLKPATYEKVNSHILKLVELCDKHSNNTFCQTKGNEVNDAMAFVEENIHIIEESFRKEAFLFLKFILTIAVSCESGVDVIVKTDINWQDVYCSAALLKLMSSLLSKVVSVFKEHGASDSIKIAKDHHLWREYEFLFWILHSFNQSCGNQMVPNVPCELLEANSASYDVIRLVLSHFIGLLFYSLQHGHVHLWKGCILMIISLLYLLSFKEGNLDSLKPLFSYSGTSFISSLTQSKVTQGKSCRRSSFVIASNFQKIRTLYLQNTSSLLTFGNRGMDTEGSIIKLEDQSEFPIRDQEMELNMTEIDRCNGENYLSLTGCNHSDIDDLANFIDCMQRKDYFTLLMKQRKFRKWKRKKIAVARRRERSKRAWMMIKKCNQKCQH